MSQVKFPFNPFQFSEIAIDQSLKALNVMVKAAEQNDKIAQQVIDFNRKNREDGLKMVEAAGEQMKQSSRLFVDMFDKMLNFQAQSYKQASQVAAQFSKS